jgi:uncharacterized protein DUF742
MPPDDEVGPAEQTFADLLNEFSLTGHRAKHRHAPRDPAPDPAAGTGRHALAGPEPSDEEEAAASVRAYTWTGGRTRSRFQLELETLVSTSDRAEQLIDRLRTEHQAVVRLCRSSRSVAEVGAILSIPLGVVRVLLGDMASLGLITVHRNPTSDGQAPDLQLLERVRHGLLRLG